jgi:PAS domain S-box-containing protein
VSADPHSPDGLRLRLAARRYQALAADPDTFLWAMDPLLRPTGPNPAWEAFTGQTYDDYATGGWVEAIAEADRDRCRAAMQAGVASQQPVSIELAIRRRDGVTRRHVFRAIPVRDERGALVEWIGTATDVEADRRAIEEQTRAAMTEHREHRELRERLVVLSDGAETVLRAETLDNVYRRIVELAGRVLPADGYAVWTLDSDSSIWRIAHAIGLSEAFVQEGVPGTELAFTEPLVVETISIDRIGPRATKYQAEGMRSLLSVPLPVEGVRRGALVIHYREPHHSTTSELQVAVSLGHLAAAAIGNAEYRDRQERMRIEAERQGQRMAFLADVSSALAELDFEASLRKLASLAVPILGDWCAIDVEDEGHLRRVAMGHTDPERLAIAQELMERYPTDLSQPYGVGHVLRTGKTEMYPEITEAQLAAGARDAEHFALLRKLGVRSALIVPLIARNRTLGVLTLVSSSPERRYGQADLEFLGVVARRAAMAIDNTRLLQETQRANRAKDEFLALLSHELRTPLNAIMGWAQLLASGRKETDEATRRGLEVIQRNARLQAELVDGLLDVARVASGGLPLTRVPIDVVAAVAGAVEAQRPTAAQRGLDVRLHTPTAGIHVIGDPNRFQQILSNLLSNAVKFTEPGGRIDIAVDRVDRMCEIAVADTGAGIEAAFLPHVFERFRQADSSTTRRHGGLGLGLWLVHELVRAHGGTVSASSPGLGKGATFTVRLPVVGEQRGE